MNTDTCEKCGAAIHIRDFPFCPHGVSNFSIVGDDVPGGFTVENGFDRPTTFTSKKAHRDALAARGLHLAPKWAGPHDKHLSRMDGPSPHTLAHVSAPEPIPITVTDVHFEEPPCS